MNICKNCKFFQKNEFEWRSKKYGYCNCKKFEYGTSGKKEKYKDKLYFKDYEGYSADFEVGEEFGCIHFEEKEILNGKR